MKSLRINTDCQKTLENPNVKGPLYAAALIGQLENQTYLLVDILPIDFSGFEVFQSFDEFLNKENDQQETPFNRFLNMTSNVKMMLGGGLSIIGIVFSVEFQNFENNSSAFKSLVDTIKDVGAGSNETIIIVQNRIKKKSDYLLYEYSQRKFSNLDYQYQSFKDKILKLNTSVEVEIILPSEENLPIAGYFDKINGSLKRWATDLNSGFVKIAGKFVDKTEVLENIKTKHQLKDNTFDCEIYSTSPIQKIYAPFENEVGNFITFQGIFSAFSYVVTKKTTFKDAYQALINELLQSIKCKLDLLVSENEEAATKQTLSSDKIHFLANRVYFDFVENRPGGLTYCDYLLSGETIQDSEQRLKEWFGLTPKYLNNIESSASQAYQEKYAKYQASKKLQQKEGITQRKKEEGSKAKPENEKEKSPLPSESVKENNLIKYGAIVGVVLILFLIRFVIL